MKSCFRYLQLGVAYHVGGFVLCSLIFVWASSSDCMGFEVQVWLEAGRDCGLRWMSQCCWAIVAATIFDSGCRVSAKALVFSDPLIQLDHDFTPHVHPVQMLAYKPV